MVPVHDIVRYDRQTLTVRAVLKQGKLFFGGADVSPCFGLGVSDGPKFLHPVENITQVIIAEAVAQVPSFQFFSFALFAVAQEVQERERDSTVF